MQKAPGHMRISVNFPSITITVVGGSWAVFRRTLRDVAAIDGALMGYSRCHVERGRVAWAAMHISCYGLGLDAAAVHWAIRVDHHGITTGLTPMPSSIRGHSSLSQLSKVKSISRNIQSYFHPKYSEHPT